MLMLASWASQAKLACPCNFATVFSRHGFGPTAKKSARVGDIFTAFYSTIFAAAALADSKVKKRRLHEWDRLIAETQEELLAGEIVISKQSNTVQSHYAPDSCHPEVVEDQGAKKLSSHKHSSQINRVSESNQLRIVNIDASSFWATSLRFSPQRPVLYLSMTERNYFYQRRGFSDDKNESILNHTQSSICKEVPETEKFVHEEPDPDAPERDITDKTELKILQININGLVRRLLEMSKIYENSSTGDIAVDDPETRTQLENMRQRLNSLDDSFECLPLYNYEGIDIARQQARELNGVLLCICRKAKAEEASLCLMIAKISYNLLISAVPPNIGTYNLLLQEFAFLGCHNYAEELLCSFWFSRLRPNKRTIELILLHYRKTKDKDGLNLIIRKMRGVDGNLMQNSIYARKYRKKWDSVEGPHERLQKFDPFDPVIRTGMNRQKFFYRFGYLYKKSPRDKYIFDALITASLEVKGLRSAIRYVSAAVRQGSKIKPSTLCSVIKYCIRRSDFTSGLKLIMIILSQWTLHGYHKLFQLGPEVRSHINRLLFFCGIDPNKGVNGHLPSRITKYTANMIFHEIEYPKEALRKLLYHMKLECLNERLSRISKLVVNLGTVLNIGEPPYIILHSVIAKVEEALELLKVHSSQEIKISNEHLYSTDLGRGTELQIRGLEANNVTTFSKMEEITTSLAMMRVEICASKLREISNMKPCKEGADLKMRKLRNLKLNLSLLHMQLRIEIHLNLWWIRRLGLASSLSRSRTQRKRLNFLVEYLTDIEIKTENLWDEFVVVGKVLEGDNNILHSTSTNHVLVRTDPR
ncbi:putative pentatricopeptide repeat domain-containing protein [Golovinomyces cichoracearum]|uniref:Putative pentatricopeptide repeat domain-containing protein n=1 Tax=Golovinomyces cichoracearum TaxID=62708 RepID=A0A420INH5_9PEZI|nr:putative pentatricopeptide repeat domain-containing protein [Golovinomyces cichoracearum]